VEWHEHKLQVIVCTENIDIYLIAETHFTKESFIRFQTYTTYHVIHPANTARGGSAIIIKNNIKHFEEEKYVTRDIQATIVTVKTSKQNLKVSAIYCPHRYCIYDDEYKILFNKLNSRFINGGDFNAKHTHWGSRLIAPKGRELYEDAVDYGCEFASTGKPTYWRTDPNKTPGLIYFFVIKNISLNNIQIEESLDLNSDD
jgi:hypothetical protein